ncbi:MAG TPA: transaldolase family protein, partial [Solirubrobacteraceae bacterium]
STATKDPAYSDVLYVEELIAPGVINTMPEATLRAFADHGTVTGAFPPGSREPEETLRRVRAAGVDLAAVTAALEREGVRSFCDAYRDILACLRGKSQRTASQPALTSAGAQRARPRARPGTRRRRAPSG